MRYGAEKGGIGGDAFAGMEAVKQPKLSLDNRPVLTSCAEVGKSLLLRFSLRDIYPSPSGLLTVTVPYSIVVLQSTLAALSTSL